MQRINQDIVISSIADLGKALVVEYAGNGMAASAQSSQGWYWVRLAQGIGASGPLSMRTT